MFGASLLIIVMNTLDPNQKKIQLIQDLLESAEKSVQHAKNLLEELTNASSSGASTFDSNVKIIEGVFKGDHLLGDDSERYEVAANYASKSKIIEGSRLRGTIMPDGRIKYTITEKAQYELKLGRVVTNDQHETLIQIDDYQAKVLWESITFFRLEEGDEAYIRVPKGQKAEFAVIDSSLTEEEGNW